MHAEKKYIFKSQVKKVWDFVSDPKKLSSCIPGLESFEEKDKKHFVAKVRPGFSFVRGTITMEMEIISLANNKGKIKINGKSIGSSFEVITEIYLKPVKNFTELSWTADMKPGGLLLAVPETVSKGAAEKLADDIFNKAKENVEKSA